MAKKKVNSTSKPEKVVKIEPEAVKTNGPSDPATLPETYTMFARKKERGFVAMTPEVSMMSDEINARKRNSGQVNNVPPRITTCIHKIKEDK